MAQLSQLCVEHAEYEGLPPCLDADFGARLAQAIGAGRLHVWLAQQGEQTLAYASASLDFSTLAAQPFVQMDCLYLRPAARGQGLGARLLHTVADFARERRCRAMQWQTPLWNEGATRFYLRQGAMALSKTRFSLAP
ncbi:GNAT family N-acetyltransferase [Paucibacter sp. B2R-40]|uniref:GNAT family N-acetyltransferase n=1 Tax=Paucibacter sp. B2R-40 TaxID=2893554 RepID=UPI0021E3D48E|nr:GNAT family N-acetyltransferase [Paucibacter sp. B2R-40]MCV2356860.1 GNAT family N-acetyltransferase [Paucibacter sp. B2R-40]